MSSICVGVKSPTLNKRWFDNVFISGDNPYIISRFCEVVLASTTIFKMVSVGPPTIRFPLLVDPPFMPTNLTQ